MTAVVLAALAGLSYGASDFSGALASKENDSTLITVAMQVVSLMALLIILGTFSTGTFVVGDLAWGALGGLGAGFGLTTFYRALALGPMSTAAAITALCSAAIPVIAGLALGEVPGNLTLLGIALAIPGAVLVSVGGIALHAASPDLPPREYAAVRSAGGGNQTKVLAVAAGFGFGLFFIALAQTSVDGGLYPLLGARLASIAALGTVVTVSGSWAKIAGGQWWIVIVAGLLDCAANSFYLFALDTGSFTWVAAISSLYPVSTVLLARVVLNERITKVQVLGLAMAAAALALVAIGR